MSRCSIAAWCLMVLCSIIFFTYSAGQNRSVTQLQKDIAGEIIRFHVRANSDTDADQQLKLYVKEELVKYMGELLKDASDRSDAENILNENIENIENVAKGVIKEHKKEYNVKAYFEESYFPVKVYADMTFPQGAVLDEDELELLYENKDGDKRERVYEFKIFTFLNKLIK